MEPCFWDPIDGTALAQADLFDQELATTMNYIIFKTSDGENITIATTRPELIPASVAIFYHPNDSRYEHLKGQTAITPLFNTIVPILPDETVNNEKGTGLVMCSTFGDTTDIMWWKKHKLPLKIVLNKQGRMDNMDLNIDTGKVLDGLNVKQARSKILELLEKNNLLVKKDNIVHHVKCAERSGAPIEILVTPQWFVKLLDKKSELSEKANECQWYPPHMKNQMDQWINGLSWDWCISRQRHFGVPFPVWYSRRKGEEGKVLLSDYGCLPIDPTVNLPNGYTRDEVDAETDVMDTWATSSITPQINSHGINDNLTTNPLRHRKLFPADLRPQAHEIIRTWAFYTLAKAYLHQNTIPWKNLMISGWCLATDKDKMSKSKGNIVSPLELMEKYGADVVRYWASTAKLGSDIVYSEKIMLVGKKLVTKLWNACKFASIPKLSNKPKSLEDSLYSMTIYETMDIWLICRLVKTINKATNEFENFEYHNARTAIEDFFWHDFCDNYLEIIKNRLYSGTDITGQTSAMITLYHAILTILKLFAPFLPHLAEELYQTYYEEREGINSIHSQGFWPKINIIQDKNQNLSLSFKGNMIDLNYSEKCGNMMIHILDVVRKIKAVNKLSHKTTIAKLQIKKLNQNLDIPELTSILSDLRNVSNANEITLDNNVINGMITADGLFKIELC